MILCEKGQRKPKKLIRGKTICSEGRLPRKRLGARKGHPKGLLERGVDGETDLERVFKWGVDRREKRVHWTTGAAAKAKVAKSSGEEKALEDHRKMTRPQRKPPSERATAIVLKKSRRS